MPGKPYTCFPEALYNYLIKSGCWPNRSIFRLLDERSRVRNSLEILELHTADDTKLRSIGYMYSACQKTVYLTGLFSPSMCSVEATKRWTVYDPETNIEKIFSKLLENSVYSSKSRTKMDSATVTYQYERMQDRSSKLTAVLYITPSPYIENDTTQRTSVPHYNQVVHTAPKTSIIRIGYINPVVLGHSSDQLQQISGILQRGDLQVRNSG
ncbi:hypothetical protein CLF_108662 [Clonorchis sinensis]|uniref:Uncharacterized protein n=1 Tax=Clonorchis sinensis TaxID=79923 RepID=G7YID2_CLOSI|nr:hypothetical protein CLF_108662 [Clonorchis sinensis]